MRIVILDDQTQVSARAAELICETVNRQPDAKLGLATGGTPLGAYREMVRRRSEGQVSFSQCTTFNLDEYLGLEAGHPQSYRTFMQEHLFGPVEFDVARTHFPGEQGGQPKLDSASLQSAGDAYEQAIADAGGIDIQLLGIGTDGHIAFNEPGSSLASRTRVKALTEQTRSDNARFFDSADEVPKLSLTMGIGSILDARRILLLATGEKKASAVRSFIEGPICAQVPASALQLHPHVTVLLDPAAASWLVRREYYEHVESLQRELESASITSPNSA